MSGKLLMEWQATVHEKKKKMALLLVWKGLDLCLSFRFRHPGLVLSFHVCRVGFSASSFTQPWPVGILTFMSCVF